MINGHVAKKRFGQNFLHDQYVIEQIVDAIDPKMGELLVEIGPGLAALTRPLLKKIQPLHVVEIDRDIISYLNNQFNNELIIHATDALKFDYSFSQKSIRVMGNLPYNISTPLLFHLANFTNIKDMHFMLQKEVVDRICAKNSTSDYGRLSVMLQYKFNCTKLFDVAKESFDPIPKVESAIVRITPKDKIFWQDINAQTLNNVVKAAFNQRRKTISNSLKNIVPLDLLERLGLDPKLRAENLSVQNFIDITKLLN